MALREVVPVMNILSEVKQKVIQVIHKQAKVHCKVFEDNSGAIEMSTNDKFCPRTKHINNKIHHFLQYVDNGSISVRHIGTLDQPEDILTKPTSQPLFQKISRRSWVGKARITVNKNHHTPCTQ